MANEYHECECPYHDVYDEKQDIDMLDDCPNQGTIRMPDYGWLCPECYDMIDAALKHWSDNIDLLKVFDDQGEQDQVMLANAVRLRRLFGAQARVRYGLCGAFCTKLRSGS